MKNIDDMSAQCLIETRLHKKMRIYAFFDGAMPMYRC